MDSPAVKNALLRGSPGSQAQLRSLLLPSLLHADLAGGRIDVEAGAEFARDGVAEAELDEVGRGGETTEGEAEALVFALFKVDDGAAKLLCGALTIGQPSAGVGEFLYEFLGDRLLVR